MTLREWLLVLWAGKPLHEIRHDPAKAALDQRQVQVASRLARMTGTTRDKVLAEAYRRADERLRQ